MTRVKRVSRVTRSCFFTLLVTYTIYKGNWNAENSSSGYVCIRSGALQQWTKSGSVARTQLWSDERNGDEKRERRKVKNRCKRKKRWANAAVE